MPKLSGSDFVAETPIFLFKDGRLVVVADTGKSCADVPVDDLERLERRGKIQRIEKKSRKEKD